MKARTKLIVNKRNLQIKSQRTKRRNQRGAVKRDRIQRKPIPRKKNQMEVKEQEESVRRKRILGRALLRETALIEATEAEDAGKGDCARTFKLVPKWSCRLS